MNHPHWTQRIAAALLFLAAAAPLAAQAQAQPLPQTQDMIQALKPVATRGLRNLTVRPKAEPAASAAAEAVVAVVAATASAAEAAGAGTPAEAAPSLSLAIQFESNSARVRPASGPLLGNLVAAMQSPELKGTRFVIEGHTDASGAPATNQRLSQERADEVRLYLVALGVHPARLKAVGKGASEPANADAPASAENRRVRVVTVE